MTKSVLKYSFVVLAMVLGICADAHGMVLIRKSPEIDPSMATGAITLLAGAITVLRVRRKK